MGGRSTIKFLGDWLFYFRFSEKIEISSFLKKFGFIAGKGRNSGVGIGCVKRVFQGRYISHCIHHNSYISSWNRWEMM